MPLEPLWTGSGLLHKLLADYLLGKIDTGLFCSNFESAWNFDVERQTLTEVEYAAFSQVFDAVVWWTPFEKDRAEYPGFRNDEEIRQAAVSASEALKLKPD